MLCKSSVESKVHFLSQFKQTEIIDFTLFINFFNLLMREVDAVDNLAIEAGTRNLCLILLLIIYPVTIEISLWMQHLLDSNFMDIFGPVILLGELLE